MRLTIDHLSAGYGDLKVLFDISLHVDNGEVVSLVGSNGAGKTTLLQIISGMVPINEGNIFFGDHDLMKMKPYQRAEMGIAHIPQGRGILGAISVRDNLVLGAYAKASRPNMNKNIENAFHMFPILKERQNQLAGSLSGGQQQMLAIARALMLEPKLLMLDEPSLGLAPIIVDEVFNIISTIAKQGVSILLVEQNLTRALAIANRGYVLSTGHLVMEGNSKELLVDKSIQSAYLGV